MEGGGVSSHSSANATIVDLLQVPRVPESYVLQPSERPNPSLNLYTNLPTVDLSSLNHPSYRSHIINEIQRACKEFGSFQVVNHGIPLYIMTDALDAVMDFFNLPVEEKMLLMSENVHDPVRYGTSLNQATDKVYFWREFIKHYSHPISNWIHLWPTNPPSYKEKMRKYAIAIQDLQKQLMGLVIQSLGLNPNYLQDEISEGSQVIAVNCYPACPEPQLTMGLPPHSDYGSITILHQSCPGLQFMDRNKNWLTVPQTEGVLLVLLGDQTEVMSNGQYKSVIHRVTVNAEKKRLSIASLHSLAMNKKMGPAPELIDKQHPPYYKDFSFKDFLDFISRNDISKGRFIDTIKKVP